MPTKVSCAHRCGCSAAARLLPLGQRQPRKKQERWEMERLEFLGAAVQQYSRAAVQLYSTAVPASSAAHTARSRWVGAWWVLANLVLRSRTGANIGRSTAPRRLAASCCWWQPRLQVRRDPAVRCTVPYPSCQHSLRPLIGGGGGCLHGGGNGLARTHRLAATSNGHWSS